MSLVLPYETKGQELGETRQAMTKRLMQYLEEIIDKNKAWEDKYYILVHAKPFPNQPKLINQKILIMKQKPCMMLACMLFGVDNKRGVLTLEWALPGDWPTYAVGQGEPVPETIASIQGSGIRYHYDGVVAE